MEKCNDKPSQINKFKLSYSTKTGEYGVFFPDQNNLGCIEFNSNTGNRKIVADIPKGAKLSQHSNAIALPVTNQYQWFYDTMDTDLIFQLDQLVPRKKRKNI